MVSRRRWVTAAAALSFAIAAGSAGCAGLQLDIQRDFSPGQLTDESRIHAFIAASFAHGFLSAHMVEFDARLWGIEDDLPPFFEALEASGYRFALQVTARQSKGDIEYEYHDVDLVLIPKSGKGESFTIPGAPGTRVADYVKALGPAARKLGVPAEVLRRGHFALFGLDSMIGSLSATDDALRKHVFGLLVLKDKLERKEPDADHLARLRPPERSLDDVNLALRVMADHFAATAQLRAEALGLLAMVRQYELQAARQALAEQVADSRRRATAWEAEHHRPTMQEFGVGMKEFKLPTPENMLAVLDKDGYISAALKIASGIATADAAATVEGFGKLAPPNSSLRIASEGAAAALRGDVAGVASAVVSLADKQETLQPLTSRLRTVEQAVADARGAAKEVRGAVKDASGALKNGKGR